MAVIHGFNSLLRVVDQTAYGVSTSTWVGTDVFNDVSVEMTDNTQLVNRTIRSQNVKQTSCEYIKGKSGGTVTINGQLTADKKFLLQGATNDFTMTTPFSTAVTGAAAIYSVTLIKDYGDNKYDIATGCVLTSLEFTLSDSWVQFSATFDAKQVKLRTTTLITGTKPQASCEPLFSKQNIITKPSNLLDFTFNISNEYDDERISYGTGLTKVRQILNKQMASLTYSSLLDSTETIAIVNGATLNMVEITISDGVKSWVLTCTGKLQSVNLADEQRQSYTKEYGMKCVDSPELAWQIIVS